MVALESGVPAGATIVAGGAAFLQDGDVITPVKTGATEAATPPPETGLRGRSGG
jgi:hypothetical protein